ncbi:hypothetical protein BU17DRAFT_86885 [Hysterangium stoloniferum]|nr:hypothetical protein BU17DRAFT_86885 [Hysterangium stoloniferum]
MSYSSDQLSAFVQAESDAQLMGYWLIASSVLAFYDTVLTFSQEVQFIWAGKFRGTAILYVTARFSMLLSQILAQSSEFLQLSAKPGVAGRTMLIERPMSALLALRCFLEIRARNTQPDATSGSPTTDLASFTSFKEAVWKISQGIIEDLGDPEDGNQGTNDGSVSTQTLRPAASEAEIKQALPTVDLLEFPWAAGSLDRI